MSQENVEILSAAIRRLNETGAGAKATTPACQIGRSLGQVPVGLPEFWRLKPLD
jgi:hypothetical protein